VLADAPPRQAIARCAARRPVSAYGPPTRIGGCGWRGGGPLGERVDATRRRVSTSERRHRDPVVNFVIVKWWVRLSFQSR